MGSRLILALLILAPSCLAANLCEQGSSTCWPAGNENLAYSANPTFSVTTLSSRILLSGNMAFSIPSGGDGQPKCINFVHDATSNKYTVTEPANMVGLFLPSNLAGKHNQQCFTYYSADKLWEASGPGVVAQ